MIHRSVLFTVLMMSAAWCMRAASVAAQSEGDRDGFIAAVDSMTDDITQPVQITGEFAETLTADSTTVQLISGQGRIQQGALQVSGARLAVFATQTASGFDLSIYGEELTINGRPVTARAFRLESVSPPVWDLQRSTPASGSDHPLLKRAIVRLFPGEAGQTQTVAFQSAPDSFAPPLPNLVIPMATPSARRLQIRPRSNDPLRFESFRSDSIPPEQVYVTTGGVNVLIEGVELDLGGQEFSPGVIDLSADRVVIWTPANDSDEFEAGGSIIQSADSRLQLYLEGNIVIRQNQHTIHATHAFYDANSNRALLLNSELKAFIPSTGGYFRVWAERMRQLTADRFHAQNAWATTSPYGKPGYRVQASDILVEPGPSVFNRTGTDPLTGQPVTGTSTWITSLNNQFIVGDLPVFYLPKISGPAEDPGIPIRRVSVTQDRIFGFQLNTVWDMNRLTGIPKQPGMRWDLQLDYRSERGPGLGTQAEYKSQNAYGPYQGLGSLYYQYDSGLDNLGLDRRRLNPEGDHRGEAIWRHRQELPGSAQIFGEIGFLSDRNYYEQYQENLFDTDKDVETLLGIRQDMGAFSGMLWGRTDLNGFEADTQWLPRADIYSFSQPLLNGLLYWNMHSSAGYADTQRMEVPSDPTDPYTPLGLPYATDASGLVAMTRHELDAPFNLGPVAFEPFVMGEAAYWDNGFGSQSIDRYLMNAGLRARLSATKIFPFVRNGILNLNGLAHKHDTMLEYAYTDSTRGINEIPQYNEIDDNAQERFRTRYTTQVFPGVIPAEFNPRNYAIRAGAGMWSSAPYHELADDQQVLRIGFRDRLQTKAGPPDNPRIRDWFIWEYGASLFPDPDRDNFGEDFGLLYSHSRWNVSDRTSFLTDTSWDLFERAQNVWSVGVLSQRSLRGSVYLGFREVTAQDYFESQMLIGSYSYQMSPKWISTASYAYDLAASESRGSSLTVSRVGLDWILHFGLGFDFSKDNVGIGVSLEPRFGPPSPTNLSYLLGLQ
jgi:hypothetical protein